MKFINFINYIFYSFNFLLVFGSWESQLNDYDVIPRIELRLKRSEEVNRKISFKTKYRDFQLILKPSEGLFTEDFQSVQVDKHGKKTPVFIDQTQYYQGFVSGSHQSSVRAFLGAEDVVNINIAMKNEIYQIESLSRYEISNSSLLIYRFSDLKSNSSNAPRCSSDNISLPLPQSDNRLKRAVDGLSYIGVKDSSEDHLKKSCTVRLVADYRFYNEHGKGEKLRTEHYLIELMDNINNLFKNTEFTDSHNNKYIGYGFVIKEMLIHTDWTTGDPNHYNAKPLDGEDSWKCEALLLSFGAGDFSDVCLSHLFTYQSFKDSTLGLAWIGTWKSLGSGGICSGKNHYNSLGMRSVNAGFSTYKDSASNHLVSLSAYLVTTHEFGHSWGADHDPDTKECSPNASGGGKFVMYTYSVVGYEVNNRIFSPCSRRSIGETISYRGRFCFEKSSSAFFCGNKRVEHSEECDVGKNNDDDICCDKNCSLRPNQKCSPNNHECCTSDCQIKHKGAVCAKADPLNPCLGDAECDGINKTCLPQKPLSGGNCTEHGKCFNGICKPFCATINLEACICDKIEETCDICCRNTSSDSTKECQPASKFLKNNFVNYKLNDGRPCSQGICQSGVCKRKVSQLIERIWKIIDLRDSNLFATFLLDNLVGTVVIFSLLLWIPASIMVSCNDAKSLRLRRKANVTPNPNT